MKAHRQYSAMLGALLTLCAPVAHAGPTVLRLHEMLAPDAAFSRLGLQAWAKGVEDDSHGQIKIEIHDSMNLGGKPAQLFDQARDGVVDLSWVVLGYSAGRFPATTTFELPFMVANGEATSRAFQTFCMAHCAAEFADVRVIAWHTHGPALIHANRAIARLEDVQGLRLRPGSAAIGQLLGKAGATPVSMPATEVYDALKSGQIEATTIPWSSEVNTAKPASDFLHFHTQAGGKRGFYTQTFALVMNKAAYAHLSPALRAVIDRHSGLRAATQFGRAMDQSDRLGREAAQSHGDTLITLTPEETARWQALGQPVIDEWLTTMKGKGLDGPALLQEARALIAKGDKRGG
jgi:TRAP-type C4-dicarboxylate transport system substrate-binding protein